MTLVPWIPYSQLVPLVDGALTASPVHQSDAGEEVRQAGGLRSLFEQVKWRRPGGRAYRNSVIEKRLEIVSNFNLFFPELRFIEKHTTAKTRSSLETRTLPRAKWV